MNETDGLRRSEMDGDGPADFREPSAVVEEPLAGGDVTEGVVRVGDTVRRPSGPTSPYVRAVLAHLEQVGFADAPRFLGVDQRGRDVLTYLHGEVAGRPWPAWVGDDEAIASVGRLLRRFDDAMAPLGVPAWAAQIPVASPPGLPPSVAGPPTAIGHFDLTPENVVFRDGRAAALIDFDLIRPGTAAEEVANGLLWWAPLMPEDDRPAVLQAADPWRRARLFVDAYDLDQKSRAALPLLSLNSAQRSWHTMKWRSEFLGGGWRRMWDAGVGDAIQRRQAWLGSHLRDFEDAMVD